MKKILLLFFFLSFLIPVSAFSLTYDKKTQTNNIQFSDGTSGRAEIEGFFGNSSNAINCKKFNYNLTQVRQGQVVFYKNNKVSSIEKGLFDCSLNPKNEPIYTLWEGLIENYESNETHIFFKYDTINHHAYIKTKSDWYYATKSREAVFWTQANANFTYRIATKDEIQHAEKLFIFYKNLDLSSRSAKIYGDKIYNSNDPIAKKESTPKKYDWMNKYNDNDIIPAGSGTGFFINRDGILLSNYHVIQGCASNKGKLASTQNWRIEKPIRSYY